MSVGIPVAVDASGRRIPTTWIDQEPQPFVKAELRCGGCGVRVHARRSSSKGRASRACFYLGEHTTHANQCPYHWDPQRGALVEEHRDVLVATAGTFELQLPATEGHTVTADQPVDSSRRRRARLVVHKRRKRPVTPVISAAVAVVKLLRRFENAPDATEQFSARHGSHVLSWSDFCFDAGVDARRLLSLTRTGDAHLGLEYPIAVHGRIDATGESKNGNSRWVRLDTNGATTHSGKPLTVMVRSRTLFSPAPPTTHLMAYGSGWKVGTFGNATEVQLWVTMPGTVRGFAGVD